MSHRVRVVLLFIAAGLILGCLIVAGNMDAQGLEHGSWSAVGSAIGWPTGP